jgi:hypothetical protein
MKTTAACAAGLVSLLMSGVSNALGTCVEGWLAALDDFRNWLIREAA